MECKNCKEPLKAGAKKCRLCGTPRPIQRRVHKESDEEPPFGWREQAMKDYWDKKNSQ